MNDEQKIFDKMMINVRYAEAWNISGAIRKDARQSDIPYKEWKEQMWETSPNLMRVLRDMFPTSYLNLHKDTDEEKQS